MMVAVIGCGAMGSIYAGLLADAGNEVIAVHRNRAHVDAINAGGLRVEGASGDRTVWPPAYQNAPDQTVELAIVAVKATQIEAAAVHLAKLCGPQTVVLTMQNGVGSADQLAAQINPDRLCVGVAASFGAIMRGPGHVFHNGMNAIRIGAFAGLPTEDLERVVAVWRSAGFDAAAVSDVAAMQWEKLICNVAYSAPCSLTGMTVGEVMDDSLMSPISQAAAREAWEVARALGIGIQVTDPIAHARAFGEKVRGARPSLLQDMDARRPSEVDVINGAVPRFAERAGIKAPVNQTLTALVKQRERAFI